MIKMPIISIVLPTFPIKFNMLLRNGLIIFYGNNCSSDATGERHSDAMCDAILRGCDATEKSYF